MQQTDKVLLTSIETRLGNVEKTLEEIMENGEMMEERLKEKMEDIKDEIEKNTLQVKRMRSKLANTLRPRTIIMIMALFIFLWIAFVHLFTTS